MSDDNVIGYVIVEKWRGTQPGILGRPRSEDLQRETVKLLQGRLAPNSSVTYELAEVKTLPTNIIPELPVKLPETKWWGAAA